MAKKDFQIVDVNSAGVAVVLHPESNADNILVGTVHKIPTISNINDWLARSTELVNARKGKAALVDKIDEIDNKLLPNQLLSAIKGVDGPSSGLDADTVDGVGVDNSSSASALWTASKITQELNLKVDNSLVVSVAAPSKLLRLNSSGLLPADITGNAGTATRLKTPLTINFTGDVSGSTSFVGNEPTGVSVVLQVSDNSHSHSSIVSGNNSIATSATDLAQFKKNGAVVSKIDSNGEFSGSAMAVNGMAVNDTAIADSLWTSGKILTEISEAFAETVNINELNKIITIGGGLTIAYGKVVSTGPGNTNIPVTFGKPFAGKVLFHGATISATEADVSCSVVPSSVANAGMAFKTSKASTNSSITWFAVGI